MSEKIVLAILVAMAIFAPAIAGDGRVHAPSNRQTIKPAAPPITRCEGGRYWCAKRADCTKLGTPCQYLQIDIAF